MQQWLGWLRVSWPDFSIRALFYKESFFLFYAGKNLFAFFLKYITWKQIHTRYMHPVLRKMFWLHRFWVNFENTNSWKILMNKSECSKMLLQNFSENSNLVCKSSHNQWNSEQSTNFIIFGFYEHLNFTTSRKLALKLFILNYLKMHRTKYILD